MEKDSSLNTEPSEIHSEEYPLDFRRAGRQPKNPIFEELIPRPSNMSGRRKKLLHYDCDNCGTVFPVRAKDRKTHPHTFCKPDCHAQWHSRNLTGTTRSGRTKERISRGKRNRAHPMEDDAQWYERAKKNIEMFRNTPEWRGKSREIQKRDRCVCQACGLERAEVQRLTAHHIYPLSNWIDDGKDPFCYSDYLLVTLCDQCHTKTEAQTTLFRWPLSSRQTI